MNKINSQIIATDTITFKTCLLIFTMRTRGNWSNKAHQIRQQSGIPDY